MTEDLRQAIRDTYRVLDDLYRRAEEEGGGFLLDCEIDADQELASIEGNAAGLLYFASRLLSLATNNVRGAHAHFDAWDENGDLVPDRLIVYKWFPPDLEESAS